MFEFEIKKRCFFMIGNLNEFADIKSAKKLFSEFEKASTNHPLEFDFSQLTRLNSRGIELLSEFFCSIDSPFVLINVPWNILEVINQNPDIYGHRGLLLSFYAPFFIKGNAAMDDLIYHLEIGENLQLLDSYKDFELRLQSKDGSELVPNFEVENQLKIVSDRYAQYQNVLQGLRDKIENFPTVAI